MSGRLFKSYAIILLAIWSAIVVLTVYEFYRTGEEQIATMLEAGSRQLLAAVKPLAATPETLSATMAEISAADSSRMIDDEFWLYFRVWQHGELRYADEDSPELTDAALDDGYHRIDDVDGGVWAIWSQNDDATGLVTQLIVEDPK